MQPGKASSIYSKAISTALFIIATSVSLTVRGIEVVEGQPAVVSGSQAAAATPNDIAYGAGTVGSSGATTYRTTGSRSNAGSAELYVQLQALQVEMSELRGLVEQQAYLIEQLSQRRMDDYLDLDRRLGELQQAQQSGAKPRASAPAVKANAAAASVNSRAPKTVEKVLEPVTSTAQSVGATTANGSSSAGASRVGAVPNPPGVAGADDAGDARSVYHAAYQQVKDREFAKAKVSLAAFIKNYPASSYVPNAHFWLGELYYLDSNLEMSRDAFLALVSDHAGHRKVAEAKFKLGKIYHQLGKNAEAKQILQSVIADHPDSKAVNPAREYLKNSL